MTVRRTAPTVPAADNPAATRRDLHTAAVRARRWWGAVLSIGVCGACAPSPPPVVVFAAASTAPVVEALVSGFEAERGVPVRCNFAASSTLARQILSGALWDVYLSADGQWVHTVVDRADGDGGTRVTLAGNRLVWIVPSTSTLTAPPCASAGPLGPFVGWMSLADPDHVPAGQRAREALEASGCWLPFADRIRRAPDVRAAVRAVESGHASIGIAYASDAANADVRVLADVPPHLHQPIVYEAVARREAPAAARDLLARLAGGGGRAAFVDHGFSPPPMAAGRSASTSAPSGMDSARVEPTSWGLSRAEWDALALSLRVAALSTVLCLVPGVVCGWMLARLQFTGKAVIDALIHLPLVLPPVVVGVLLLWACGRDGFPGTWLPDPWRHALFSWWGAALAAAIVGFPLMVRAVRLAIELVDRQLEDAARTLGATPWQVWWRITLPLARSGVVSGSILAFIRSLGEFGATITFVGNIPGRTATLPVAMYGWLQIPGGDARVVRLLIVSVAVSFLALVLSEWWARRDRSRG